MRAATTESIRDNWFSILYAAWLWTPAIMLMAGFKPDRASLMWVLGAVAYLAVGLWIAALMFRRHHTVRVRLSDLTIARASAHAESVPERLERLRTRLRWARADGVFNVALPTVLTFFVVSLGIIGFLAANLGQGSWLIFLAAVPLTFGAVVAELRLARTSGARQVRRLVERMGHVVTDGPAVALFASELESTRIASGESSAPVVAILESPAYNAFSVGFGVKNGIIVVTSALARVLGAAERMALTTEMTLALHDRESVFPGEDTREARERLLDLETVMVTADPDGVLGLLRLLCDRETNQSAWCAPINSLSRRSPASAALIWPLVDLDDRDGQTAGRILALDEALRAEGYYTDSSATG